MKNKTFKILEIGANRTFLINFTSETVKDRGKPSAYYRKLSIHFIQQQQQNWMKNTNYIYMYLSNMRYFGIWDPLRAILNNKNVDIKFSAHDAFLE
jgi:hypothetical protein